MPSSWKVQCIGLVLSLPNFPASMLNLAPECTGGSPARVAAANAIVDAGVAVMGHVGLSPQSISVLGVRPPPTAPFLPEFS